MKFKTFFITEASAGASEEKLTHLEHAEDHHINAGAEGFDHAFNTLHNTHELMAGRKSKATVSLKLDGCLHEDTLILMSDGSSKSIKEIATNWSLANMCNVVGVDEDNNLVESTVVDKLVTQSSKKWVQIDTDSGIILLTEDHLVMTKNGWVEAGKLTEGEEIVTIETYK
jgi:hypothetical protein